MTRVTFALTCLLAWCLLSVVLALAVAKLTHRSPAQHRPPSLAPVRADHHRAA